MRELNLLQALGPQMYPVALEEGTETYFKDKIMVGYSNGEETNAVEWELVSLPRRSVNWEEMQYDRETNHGKSFPHDMLWGWKVLPFSPVVKRGGNTQKAFDHFTTIHLKSSELPSLDLLKRLKAKDGLQSGMWILLVRTPRPFAAKISVPLSRKKEYGQRFASESEAEYLARTQELKRRSDLEKHPTEDNLYVTRNLTLLQGVTKNVVCTKCGAKGHHHERTHDDVYAPAPPQDKEAICCAPKFPDFMNVQPYPSEEIQLTKMLGEDKGFTLSIRETSTKVPLRLARKLLLDGLSIEGEIHASGVGKRKRILHDAEEETFKANIEAKRRQKDSKPEDPKDSKDPKSGVLKDSKCEVSNDPQNLGVQSEYVPLVIDMNYEWETDRRFTIETYIRLAREHGFKEEANKVAKQYLASLNPKHWKPDYLFQP